jgi:hypothetical protein
MKQYAFTFVPFPYNQNTTTNAFTQMYHINETICIHTYNN